MMPGFVAVDADGQYLGLIYAPNGEGAVHMIPRAVRVVPEAEWRQQHPKSWRSTTCRSRTIPKRKGSTPPPERAGGPAGSP